MLAVGVNPHPWRVTNRLLALTALLVLAALPAQASEELACASGQRKVSFTTSSGTSVNLDVSPDGKRLVLDLLGDIYVLPIEGGRAKALTHGTAWNARPVWSPNGDEIAFISDRMGSDQVFVVRADGEGNARQISVGQDMTVPRSEGLIHAVEWMPDAKSVVVGGRRLRTEGGPAVGTRMGGQATDLYSGNGIDLYRFHPIPDSARQAGASYSISKHKRESGEWQPTGDTIRIANASLDAPAVSRDGRWIVYKERSLQRRDDAARLATEDVPDGLDTIRVRDRSDNRVRTLMGPGLPQDWRSNGVGDLFPVTGRYALTPDSRYLIAAHGGSIHRINLRTGKRVLIPMRVDVKRCLAPIVRNSWRLDHGPLSVRNMRNITLRPDGKQMAFSALRRLYVQDLPDGEPRILTSQESGQFQPVYSPDGRWIAFVTWNETYGGHVWVAPANGGYPERMTNAVGHYQTPAWSPDGRLLAVVASGDLRTSRSGFNTTSTGGFVQVISVADRSVRKLPARARLGHPLVFSRKGDRIHYAAHAGGPGLDLQISSIGVERNDIHEEGARRLLPQGRGGAAIAVPSPDGLLIALLKDGDLHLVHCSQSIGAEDFDAGGCTQARVTRAGAYDPHWRAGGRELEWSFANVHYRVSTQELLEWMMAGGDARSATSAVRSTTIRLDVPRLVGLGSAVLSGARIVTMRGDEVIENGEVHIHNGYITYVGAPLNADPAKSSLRIDLRGKTLTPGFVDAHAHQNDLPRDLLDGNNGEMLVYLSYGVTTIKNPSNGGDHAFAYEELLEAGEMVGPRLLSAEGLVSHLQAINSYEDALAIADRTARLGGTYLKYHSGWTRKQRQWIVAAAMETGLNVTAHYPASNYVGRFNLSTITDGATTSEHEFSEVGGGQSDSVRFIAQSGTTINFSPLATRGGYASRYWKTLMRDPRLRRFHVGSTPQQDSRSQASLTGEVLPPLRPAAEDNARLVAAIAHAGGDVAIGSHGDFDGIGFHLEMWAHVRGGMTPHEVLRSATLHGARAVGLEADLGSIEVGKIADLIILAENPLDDIRNTLSVERVMKDGVLRNAHTLDEIWPEQVPLSEWRLRNADAKPDGNGLRTAH